MTTYTFNARRFANDLDAIRDQRRLSWRRVAAETGVTPSTFTRMQQGRCPDASTLVTLILWMDRPIERYAQHADEDLSEIHAMRPSEV